MNRRRMPAEWESPKRVLLTFPNSDTDWDYMLPRIQDFYKSLIKTFNLVKIPVTVLCNGDEKLLTDLQEGRDTKLLQIISDVEFNDTWIRDYGPITVEEDKKILVDFGFNGWGLKFASDHDNLVNLHLTERDYLPVENYENRRDFILEGGSIESDGKGTILTTSRCLLSPNRNGGKDRKVIEKRLREALGAERILWLDHGFLAGDDTDSHIDTLARMAPNDTIVYVGCPDNRDDEHFDEFARMERQLKQFKTESGKPYRLVRLPFPDAIHDDEGNRLPATYANYLVMDRKLFMPIYNQQDKDKEAILRINEAFPGYEVFSLDCTPLLFQHGSLHCSTMQLY